MGKQSRVVANYAIKWNIWYTGWPNIYDREILVHTRKRLIIKKCDRSFEIMNLFIKSLIMFFYRIFRVLIFNISRKWFDEIFKIFETSWFLYQIIFESKLWETEAELHLIMPSNHGRNRTKIHLCNYLTCMQNYAEK